LLRAVEQLGHGVVELDGDRIAWADRRFCDLVGYGLDELQAMPDVLGLTVPERRDAARAALDQLAAGRWAGTSMTMSLLRGDGQVVAAVFGLSPLPPGGGDRGSAHRVLVVVEDRSEDRRRAQQLAAYGEILHRMPAGLLLWRVEDLDDPGAITLSMANRAAMLGSRLRPSEVAGRSIGALLPATLASRWARDIVHAHRSRSLVDLGEVAIGEDDAVILGPALYRCGLVPLTGALVAQLVENVSARREADRYRGELQRRVLDASTEERRRIAADLHDDAVQALAALGLEVGALRHRPDPARLDETLARVEDGIRGVIGGLRDLVFELSPPELDEGLGAAVDLTADRLFVGTGTEVRVEVTLAVEPEPRVRTMVHRILAEALTNARKHAEAAHVTVEVWSAGGLVRGVVRDDGRGAETLSAAPGHIGLRTMRERAEVLGGSCTVRSTPGEGTTVELQVPLSAGGVAGDLPR
jgi:signal transduction histidine kinase